MKLYIYHTWNPTGFYWTHEIDQSFREEWTGKFTEVECDLKDPSREEILEMEQARLEKNIQDSKDITNFWEKELELLETKLSQQRGKVK